MKDVLDPLVVPRRFYKQGVIVAVAVLAGPVSAALLLWENFRAMGEERRATNVLVWGSIISVGALLGIFLLPERVNVPNFLFPAIFGAVASLVTHRYQGARLKEHLAASGEFHSGWRAFGYAMLGLLLTIVMAIVLVLLVDLFELQ